MMVLARNFVGIGQNTVWVQAPSGLLKNRTVLRVCICYACHTRELAALHVVGWRFWVAGQSVVGYHRAERLALQNVGNSLVLRTLQDAVWSQGPEGADYQKKAEAGRAVCHHNRTTALHMKECALRSGDDGHSFEKTGLCSLTSHICMWAARGLCWLVSLHMGVGIHSSD